MSLFDFLKNKKRAEKKKEVVKSKSESPKGEFNKKTEKEYLLMVKALEASVF